MPKWTRPSEAMPDPAVCDNILVICRYPRRLRLELYEWCDGAEDFRVSDAVGGVVGEDLKTNKYAELWAYESDVCEIANILRESTK